MRDNFAVIFYEVSKQFKFFRRKMNFFIFDENLMSLWINEKIADFDFSFAFCVSVGGAAQSGADSR